MTAQINGPYVIGFNGPPRSGKDTIADLLAGQIGRIWTIPVHRCILAAPMRKRVEALVGDGTTSWYGREKDIPIDLLAGDTPRKCMIRDSEEFLKHRYGQDFWARLYHHNARHWWGILPAIVLVSDIGFGSEVEYFCRNAGAYVNVHTYREGCDFSIDSRNYVDATQWGGIQMDLQNDSYPMAAVERMVVAISEFGWKL